MTTSHSNFLDRFESRWLETWRRLARSLADSHPIEWDVWSHRFGAGGHTAGIELRSSEPGYAERVFCLVDFVSCDNEPTIEAAELRWTWPWNVGENVNRGCKSAFSEVVPLNSQNWRKLEDCLEQWTSRLRSLLTSRDPKHEYPGFISRAYGYRDFESTASGKEPDFPIWSAYLETQPETLLVDQEAMGTENEEHTPDMDCFKKALLALEPSLDKEMLKNLMSQPPLQLSQHLKTSRPIQFVEPPTGSQGYRASMRQLLGRHPGATGVLSLSRVSFGKGQVLFLAGVQGPSDLNSSMTFAFGEEALDGWTFRHLSIDEETLDAENEG